MKKGLILSYYFPPANSVATPRVFSFAEHFNKQGIFLTVITRHWTGNEKFWYEFTQDNVSPLSLEENSRYCVYRLPYQSHTGKVQQLLKTTTGLSNIYFFLNILSGHFTLEANARICFRRFLKEHLQKNKYDFVLASGPPLNIIRLASEIAHEFDLPLVLDFRDIWNNYKLQENYSPSKKTQFFLHRQEHYARKWMHHARLVSTVTWSLEEEIKKLYPGKTAIITNGFEQEIFSAFPERPANKKFTFSIVGTVYAQQDLSIMIEGLKQFINEERKNSVTLNFIGIGALPSIEERIKSGLTGFDILITEKIKREEALEYMKNADVLFYPAWKGYKGIMSAKIFEYTASKRKIMIAPGDEDVIDKLVIETKTGSIANSVDEFVNQLGSYYSEWKNNGYISHQPDYDKINFYTRQNQAEIFAREILSVL